ncbi:MAG: hypothetical protein ACD_15C00004G0004 [uncultured bacterium]|nr:MAG: hypothetical protein ACD_15C00004G0004 [uncultured bacterium]HCU70727.1 hypothetical protein [Candidatus Moranbacteria bacterium]
MEKKIVINLFAFLLLIISFFSWRVIDQAINVPEASVWAVPMIFISLFFVFSYASIILIKKIAYLQVLFLLAYILSFVFVRSIWHMIGIGLAFLFTSWAVLKIKKDLRMNVEINIWKSMRAGSGILVLAVSIMITSQYYLAVKNLGSENLIPQFYISSITGNLTTRFLSATNPEIEDIDKEFLTVDQFILQTQKSGLKSREISMETSFQIDQMIEKTNPSATAAQKKIMKEDALQKVRSASLEIGKEQESLLLAEGRKKFSEMAGKNLQGNEKMSDVLADIVNRKIDQYFGAGAKNGAKASVLPYVMAIGLFLTVIPLGSILNTLWIMLVQFLVWIFLETKILSIKKASVEVEILE